MTSLARRCFSDEELEQAKDYFKNKILDLKTREDKFLEDEKGTGCFTSATSNKNKKSKLPTKTDYLIFRNACYFIIGINTGFRVSELLSIKIKQVYDLVKKKPLDHLNVERQFMKKKIRNRNVPLNAECKKYISLYIDHWHKIFSIYPDSEDFLFTTFKNIKKREKANYTWYQRIIKRICKDIGIDFDLISNHSMRKTLARKAFEMSGNDIIVVKEVLGHSSINSTQHYLSANKEKVSDIFLHLNS